MTTASIEPPSPAARGSRNRALLIVALIAAVGVVAIGALALLSNQPPPSLTAELPPVVVDRAPERGEEQGATAPIVLVFDKPMDRESTEKALTITPGVPYTVEWRDDDTRLEVVPAGEGFERDATYEVKVAASALATNGKNLAEELLFKFKAVGYLEVTQVVPAPDAEDIAIDSDVTVMFNRPVVPLTSISNQRNLPQPVTFDPPIEGSGEWLNTSIYVFHSEGLLQAGTTYTAKVAAGLSDPSGAILPQDYAWSFSTQPPFVLATEPGESETNVWLDRAIRVQFNQAMDRESAQAAFSLTGESGAGVAGEFDWPGEATMVFTPTQLLSRDRLYTAQVAAGAQAIGGGSATELDTTWQFRTVPELRVVRTSPRDGQTGVDPYTAFEVYFSAPVDEKTLWPNIFATPPVSLTDVYTYYSSYDNRYVYAFSAGPSSPFTVTIAGEVADPWGGTLGADQVVHFETRALSPEARLNVPGRFGVYSAYTDTVVYASYRNVSQLDFALYPVSPEEFARLTGPESWQLWERPVPVSSDPIRAWSIPVEASLNELGLKRIPLVAPPEGEVVEGTEGTEGTQGTPADSGRGQAEGTQAGGALAPGIYFLRVSAPEQPIIDFSGTSRHLLIVSTANVTFKTAEREALVWATDLQSGQPLSGAPVALRNAQFSDIGGGRTNPEGLFTVDWLEKRDPFEIKYAIVGAPGALDAERTFGVTLNDWSSGIEGYEFGVPTEYFSDPYRVYLYTEKPLYRPGQTVHFKGVVRAADNTRYTVDSGLKEMTVDIFDPNGTQVYSVTLPLGELGTLNADFVLDEEAALGYYALNARIPIPQSGGREKFVNTYGQTFLVSEYRRPEFVVEVTPAKDEYGAGEAIQFSVQAAYFFGGAVSGGKVTWTVLSNDYFFDRYRGPGYWNWYDSDYMAEYRGGNLIASGEGVLDDNGQLLVELPANLDEKAGSQTFTLEATVVDINDQAVSARADVIVHKGLFYIGLQPDEYVGVAGQPLLINVRAVDWSGDPYGQANLDVVFYEREWFSVQQIDDFGNVFWTSTFSDTAVFTTSTTTTPLGGAQAAEGGEAQVGFTPPSGGEYRVVATGKDPDSREVRSSAFVWVSSEEYVAWRQDNNDRIQLVADKREYAPGETAKVLVPSPFQGEVTALLTVERARIMEHRLIALRSNSEVIEIPITPDMAPNAFVSVVIVKGVDETNPVPAFRVGYASFAVSIEQQVLNVSIAPDKNVEAGEHYGPRETVTYTVKVTDYAGHPAQAELSMALTDYSVLTLLDDFAPPIDRFYYGEQGLGVRTASALVLSVDRINIVFAEEGKGGGGGALAEEGGSFVRQQFPDTVYWNATLMTDANGEATVSVQLADNLTTWRMRAKAVTQDTLVGEAHVDIISTKDLLVRPLTPRFFVVGDELSLAAIVHNNTDAPIQASVTLEGTGIQIDGQIEQSVDIPAGDRVRVEWPATVLDTPQADLTFSARGGGLSDASKPPAGLPPDQRLPIYKYSTPETTGTAGTLDLDESTDLPEVVTEIVVLPGNIDTTASRGDLTVQIDPSLASAQVEGLDYLEHFPYECTEQTVSRFLPNVLTYRALKELGLADAALESKLEELVGTGLQRLYNQQHADGGWGWWVNEQSDTTTSAYVVLGMAKAREAGFAVDGEVVDRGLDFLRRRLTATTRINQTYVANRQAFVLYALAEAGEPQTDAAVSLYDSKRGLLSNYARAYLALALSLDPSGNASRVDTLLSDLNNAAKLSATGAHWEEGEHDTWNWNTDTRSTAIVLDALARLDPQNPLAPNVVRWLMVARTVGRWESTQETVWALIALTDWMKATGELNADYSWSARLNDEDFGSGVGNQETLGDPVVLHKELKELLLGEANALTIEMKAAEGQTGEGRLYYTAHLETFVPVETVQSLTRGISVARQYFSADDECFKPRDAKRGEEPIPCTPVTGAKVGDVLQVRLTIVAPNDLYYVKVEDPLPAGAEAIDTSLKTTSQINEAPELSKTSPYSYYDGWGWWWFTRTELRDEKVVLFASYLPAGTYEYTYQVRAGLQGTYKVIPPHAEEMYFPEVFGRGDGMLFEIER
ncbi:MAG TPA: Ig-like domain-containing protein [Anaerolineae bacterium]|nr:Ig-like domain-containing protein [Anaerolineae bacterium]